MKRVIYCLPDSAEKVFAYVLWQENNIGLLFVQSVKTPASASLVIATRKRDGTFEDSVKNTFPLEDWSAAMISVHLMLIVKGNEINEPNEYAN
jgi:hypothetical protein